MISVLDPKNRAVMGRLQVRPIRAEDALAWLLWYVPHLPQEACLWPSSPATFRNMLDEALRFLSLENCRFTPGSLRAGGAIHRLETGISHKISNSKGLGPRTKVWSYLQEAEAAATLLRLSPRRSRKLEIMLREVSFLTLPPAASLPSLT